VRAVPTRGLIIALENNQTRAHGVQEHAFAHPTDSQGVAYVQKRYESWTEIPREFL
jgi:hypothetical protein